MNTFDIELTAIRTVEKYTGKSFDIKNGYDRLMFNWFVEGAKSVLSVKRYRPVHISPEYMLETACIYFDTSIEDIKSPSRDSSLVRMRKIICLLLHNSGISSVHIGSLMDRDHSTILYSIKNAKLKTVNDCRYKDDYVNLLEVIKEVESTLNE